MIDLRGSAVAASIVRMAMFIAVNVCKQGSPPNDLKRTNLQSAGFNPAQDGSCKSATLWS